MKPELTDDTLFCALLVQQAYRRMSRPLVEITTDVLTGKKTAYVAVKGTDGLPDVWADVKRCRVPFLGTTIGLAHEGFNEVVELMVGPGDLRKLFADCHRIVFTGHSLGGAVASLLAIVYATIYSTVPVDVVTFGSPRCMNGKLARQFNRVVRTSLRITHDRDPIPRIPFFGYKHVKGRCSFGDDGKLQGRLKGGWHTFLFWLQFRHKDIADHTMTSYVKSLEQYLDANSVPATKLIDEPITPWGQP